jgi:hypothetical protein
MSEEEKDQKEEDDVLSGLLLEHPIHDLIKFDDINLQKKIQENTTMVVRYRDLYHQELAKLDRLKDLLDKLVGKRYEFYRFNDDKTWTKVEIEKYALPADEKVIQMKKIVRRQEIRVRFFEMCWKAFDKQQWSMRMFIETLKGEF